MCFHTGAKYHIHRLSIATSQWKLPSCITVCYNIMIRFDVHFCFNLCFVLLGPGAGYRSRVALAAGCAATEGGRRRLGRAGGKSGRAGGSGRLAQCNRANTCLVLTSNAFSSCDDQPAIRWAFRWSTVASLLSFIRMLFLTVIQMLVERCGVKDCSSYVTFWESLPLYESYVLSTDQRNYVQFNAK